MEVIEQNQKFRDRLYVNTEHKRPVINHWHALVGGDRRLQTSSSGEHRARGTAKQMVE